MKKDALGDRMKRYEKAFRQYLQPRTYTIIRVDGKAFHTFTKGLDKPFDDRLSDAMVHAMAELFNNIQGVKYAYTQSDEISLVLTDFDTYESQPWFGGKAEKITSVSSSLASNGFNMWWIYDHFKNGMNTANYWSTQWAAFDSRPFQLPNREEVINYFIWRQQDAIRNSISSLAQTMFSQNQLHGKSQIEMIEMCKARGVDWLDMPLKYQRGIGYYRWEDPMEPDMVRTITEPDYGIPIFSQNREYLKNLIPDYI